MSWFKRKPKVVLTPNELIAVSLGYPLEIEELWLPFGTHYLNGRKVKLWFARKRDTYEVGDIITVFQTRRYKYPYLNYKILSYSFAPGNDWAGVSNKEYNVKFIGFGRKRR